MRKMKKIFRLLGILCILFSNIHAAVPPCTNATQNPVATQSIPTDGTSMNISSNTTNFFQCSVISGQVSFVYSSNGCDALTTWGTTHGTGVLGSDAGTNGYVFTSATTTTSIWIDINGSGNCGGSSQARTVTVELLPYNIVLPGGIICSSNTITITGNALKNVNLVTFSGGATAVPSSVTATSFNVIVPATAQSGPITLQTSDGTYTITNAPSSSSLTIESATG